MLFKLTLISERALKPAASFFLKLTFSVSVIFYSAPALSFSDEALRYGSRKVVFIYKNDEANSFDFYFNAIQYYKQQNNFEIVTEVTSLEYIHNWLEKMSLYLDKPFEEIHVVTHGSFQKGLSLPVIEGRQRKKNNIISFKGIEELTPLPSRIINKDTRFKVLACGIGRHTKTLAGLKKMFVNENGEPPVISASKGYHFFEIKEGVKDRVESFELEFYSAIIGKSFEWDYEVIAEIFQAKYPSIKIDWLSAIKNQVRYDSANPFSISKAINLEVLAYKDDLGRLGSIDRYIEIHPEISQLLNSQLVIGKVEFEQKEYSKKFALLSSKAISLKIFLPKAVVNKAEHINSKLGSN